MAHCDQWYSDETFKAAPPLVMKIYTTHAVKYNSTIPTVFALIPNKSQDIYVRLFSALKDLNLNLNPRSIMTGFKQSTISAFHQAFPNASQRGCFFYLSQCLWRWIQWNEGFVEKYDENSEFTLNIRPLPALVLVPVSDVVFSFKELIGSEYFEQKSNVFSQLFITLKIIGLNVLIAEIEDIDQFILFGIVIQLLRMVYQKQTIKLKDGIEGSKLFEAHHL